MAAPAANPAAKPAAKPGAAPVPPVPAALLARAFRLLADDAGLSRKAKVDPRSAAMRAALGWSGDAAPDFAPDAAALARRLSALGEMLERIEPGAQSLDVLIEAAAAATVVDQAGRPLFHPLDFHARVHRIASLHAARGCSCCS